MVQENTTKERNYAINEPLMNNSHDNEIAEADKVLAVPTNNPAKGYTFMLMFVIANSMADSASKILFINHKGLGVQEMLFLRGAIFLFVMVILIGKDAKHILYDSIPRNMFLPIFIRCCSGLLGFYCFTTAIKHLPIIIVALFQNTIPLFTSLFGFLILRESITVTEVLCLFLAFFGVYVLISS